MSERFKTEFETSFPDLFLLFIETNSRSNILHNQIYYLHEGTAPSMTILKTQIMIENSPFFEKKHVFHNISEFESIIS